MRHGVQTLGSCARLLREEGGRYATALGIDLSGGGEPEVFKWFLASVLYGARISQEIAARTYREFARARVLSPRACDRRLWILSRRSAYSVRLTLPSLRIFTFR